MLRADGCLATLLILLLLYCAVFHADQSILHLVLQVPIIGHRLCAGLNIFLNSHWLLNLLLLLLLLLLLWLRSFILSLLSLLFGPLHLHFVFLINLNLICD